MAAYRASAERVSVLQIPTADPRLAIVQLADATARGVQDSKAREEVASWLGDPDARMGTLRDGLSAAHTVGPPMSDALLNDVRVQAEAMRLLATYDMAQLVKETRQAEARLVALNHAGPGQNAGIRTEFEAARLDAAIEAATSQVAEEQERIRELDSLDLPPREEVP